MKTITSKSGKKIIFRLPKKDDLDALYKYAKKIEAEDTFITLNPQEPLTYKEEDKHFSSSLKDIKKGKKVQILVLDGKKIIGMSHVQKQGRRSGHVGQLGIALLKQYRAEGIGKKLVKHILNLAKKELKISKITLSCFVNNKIALSFYKKLGFIQFGYLPQANQYKGKLIDSLYFYKNL